MPNDIIEYFLGVPIRKSNRVNLRLGASAYKALLAAQNETGLSAYGVLMHSSKPCAACTEFVNVEVNGHCKKIKRGILSRHAPQKSGSTIFEQKRKKDAEGDTISSED